MTQFWALVKMNMQNKRGEKSTSIPFQCLKTIFKILIYLVCAAVVSVVIYFALNVFINSKMEKVFLIFYITMFHLVIFISSTIQIVKVLRSNAHIASILTYPVRPIVIFASQIFFFLLYQYILTFILMTPLLVIFGVLTKQMLAYYAVSAICFILAPLIPFGVAVLVSFPIVKLINKMNRHPVFLLICFMILIALGFVIYIRGLNWLLSLTKTDLSQRRLGFKIANLLQDVSKFLVLSKLMANVLNNVYFYRSLLVYILLTVLLFFVIFYLANKNYNRILRSAMMLESGMKIKSKIKYRSPTNALLKKDLKLIFRSSTYTFSYLATTLATPIMVFVSNVIISNIGASLTGSKIYPALTFFILILFLSISTSFSATTITREGKIFSLTKIFPLTPKQQVYTKMIVYLIVTIPAAVSTTLILYIAKFINLTDFIFITASVVIYSVSSVCYGVNLDLKKPRLSSIKNNEIVSTNANMNRFISVQILLAFIIGFSSIVMIFLLTKKLWTIFIFTFAIIYLVLNLFKLNFRLNKKFVNIQIN